MMIIMILQTYVLDNRSFNITFVYHQFQFLIATIIKRMKVLILNIALHIISVFAIIILFLNSYNPRDAESLKNQGKRLRE